MNNEKDDAVTPLRLNAGLERTFTLAEIKAAFWSEFHQSGEQFFLYPQMMASQQECEEATESYWRDFMDELTRSNRY